MFWNGRTAIEGLSGSAGCTGEVRVAVLLDDVAEIDTDPEIQPLIRAHICIAPSHSLLHLDGTAHRIDDAGELGQQPVTRRLDDPPAMLGDAWIEQFTAMAGKAREGAFIVGADQPTISGNVSRKDRRELSPDAVGFSPSFLQSG